MTELPEGPLSFIAVLKWLSSGFNGSGISEQEKKKLKLATRTLEIAGAELDFVISKTVGPQLQKSAQLSVFQALSATFVLGTLLSGNPLAQQIKDKVRNQVLQGARHQRQLNKKAISSAVDNVIREEAARVLKKNPRLKAGSLAKRIQVRVNSKTAQPYKVDSIAKRLRKMRAELERVEA